MNKFCLIFLVGFGLILQNCSSTRPGKGSDNEYVVETLKSINRYYHSEIIPKLNDSWGKELTEKGDITFEYIYKKNSSGNWIFQEIKVDTSSISRNQTAIALNIMLNAVDGTELPTKHGESEKQLYLYYTWPVPFPEGTFDKVNAVFKPKDGSGNGSGNKGGCDGQGTPARCFNITAGDCPPCDVVCVGYLVCKQKFDPTIGRITCGAEGACASGGPFNSRYVMH